MAYKSCKDTIDLETMGPGTRTTKAVYKRGIKKQHMGPGKTWPEESRDGLKSPPWTDPKAQTLQVKEGLSGTEPV